jgi:hypothetical protein
MPRSPQPEVEQQILRDRQQPGLPQQPAPGSDRGYPPRPYEGIGLRCRLLLERHQALQVAVVEEQIRFKILIANLHAHLLANKGIAVAQFHEEFAQIAQ